MSEHDEYPDMPLDFSTFVDNRMNLKKSEAAKTSFDPYQTMLNKKKLDSGEYVEPTEIPIWSEKDMKALRDFCQQNGILGFSCGHMHPVAALSFLKNKMGIIDGTSENRVPYGYNKIENSSKNKPSILHG